LPAPLRQRRPLRWPWEDDVGPRAPEAGGPDSVRVTFSGPGPQTLALAANGPIDISREATGELSVVIEHRVEQAPTRPVTVAMDAAAVPVAGALRTAPRGEWGTLVVPLRCFVGAGLDPKKVAAPLTIRTDGRLALAISSVRVASAPANQSVLCLAMTHGALAGPAQARRS